MLWNMEFGRMVEERFGVSADILRGYAEAHNEGKALIVPCKPGDTLYQVSDGESGVEELVCEQIEIAEKDKALYPVVMAHKADDVEDVVTVYPAAFGFYVFTDRAEAVASLRRKMRCGMCISGGFQHYSLECETCQYNRKGIDHATV